MKLVTHISSITNAYNFAKNFKKSFSSNSYNSNEKFIKFINKKKLYEIKIDDVVYFLKDENDFMNLYYYAASLESLNATLPKLLDYLNNEILVVDLISKTELCKEKQIFELNKFNIYTSLVRMNSFELVVQNSEIHDSTIRSAMNDEVDLIANLLYNNFDPKAEHLPDVDEITTWIKSERIIVSVLNKKIVGFIIYDLYSTTLYLRYWFVDPLHRNLKIGSKLFREFRNRGKNTSRQLFWVIRSNENAIKRYLHYGFKEENMYNYVLINNNENYEKYAE
jgi:ribosomal protein S18 acetylase RimI-like enzyme